MTKHYGNITCAILTRSDLATKKNELFERIEHFDLTCPTDIGNYEPIRTPYRSAVDALEHWGDPFLWRSAKTRTSGSIWIDPQTHSAIIMYVKPSVGVNRGEDIVRFFRELCAFSDADFGYIHYTTSVEQNHQASDYDAVYAIDLGVATANLRCGIPNVPWAMWIGAPYASVVAELRPFANQGFTLEERGVGSLLRVDVPLSSLKSDYEGFLAIRNRIRNEFAPNCFGTKKKPSAWRPNFDEFLTKKGGDRSGV